jgi:hypothetical protein
MANNTLQTDLADSEPVPETAHRCCGELSHVERSSRYGRAISQSIKDQLLLSMQNHRLLVRPP